LETIDGISGDEIDGRALAGCHPEASFLDVCDMLAKLAISDPVG